MFREILNLAEKRAGNQEKLALVLEMTPGTLSKKKSGESKWSEDELDSLFAYAQFCTSCRASQQKETEALSETIRIVLEGKKRLQDDLKPVFKKERCA